ncbi:zinc finger protein 454-like [Ochlerotatus camptorhynchus]|uniref:zinc finger protein 454-like n=1 Tax=Ochlerotatus camptorhynchus TaxID=644619 RepID=UPI0031CE3AA2
MPSLRLVRLFQVSENDSISRSICFLCRTRLHEFRDFQLRCLEVQDVLQSESTPVVKEEPLDEAEEAGPSSEAAPQSEADAELTTATEEILQPTEVAAEHGKIPKPTFRLVTKRVKYDHEKKTECSICGEKIHDSRMEGHQNKHKGLQPYKCMHGCVNVSFHSRQVQLYHYRNMHSAQQYECDICDKLFQSRKKLYDHKRVAHTSRTKVCSICGKAFLTPSALKDHMNYHNPNRERKFPCPVHKNWRMKLHMKIHDNDDESRRTRSSAKQDLLEPPRVQSDGGVDCTENPIEQVDAGEEHFSSFETGKVKMELEAEPEQAQYSDAVVAGSSSWVECGGEPERELQPTTATECSSQQQDESNSESEQQQSSNFSRKRRSNPLINCPICGKQIKESAVEGHQNLHNDHRPYKCERGCDDVDFHCRTSRKNHYRFAHSTQQECDICHKLYTSEASLANHKKYMHAEKRFNCAFCDKAFTTSAHTKQHMKKNHLY